jgi:hypothetical protein
MTCQRCGDLGIVHLRANGGLDETLAYCVCERAKGADQVWDLPEISRDIAKAFVITRCPLSWFLPDNERGSVPRGQLLASIGAIAERWRSRIRNAETFWREHAELFGEGA